MTDYLIGSAEQPSITAIAPWFGGKRNLAPTIAAELGPHRVYWSLFCGSLPELAVMQPCVMETVNDLHGDLTNLARVIRDPKAGAWLYRRLRRTLMSEDLFNESGAVIRTEEPHGDIDAERAYHYFLTAWLGRNGVAGTSNYNSNFCVRYTANGGHAAKRFASAIRSIPWWRRRLRNVTILRRDAFELLPRIDDRAGTAIYADPPYLRKGAKYKHDFGADDHKRLASALRRFKAARVVVSYYDEPELAELYDGWTFVRINVSKALACAGKRGDCDTKATEVLLINGPSVTQPTGPSLFGARTC